MVTKTLNGPNGLRIELDSREIIPHDPGAGTPAMVHLGDHSATYGWACGEGYLYHKRDEEDRELTHSQLKWLHDQEYTVGEFIEENTPED